MIYRREDVYQLGFSCPHDEVAAEESAKPSNEGVECD